MRACPPKARTPAQQAVTARSARNPRIPRAEHLTSVQQALPLAELRRLARLVQAGLLALDLACVAREVALALERHAQLGVRLDERTRDAVADGAGLARQPAAVHAHAQVVLALEACRLQRRRRDRPPERAREVLLDRLAVDPRRTVAGAEDHAGDGRLALAGAAVLGDLTQITAPGSKAVGSAARAGARGRRRS